MQIAKKYVTFQIEQQFSQDTNFLPNISSQQLNF